MSRPAVGTAPAVPLQIRTVTVLGASGTMGAAAAGLFAAYGEAQVYVTGRDSRRTAAAVGRAARSVRGDSIRTRMTPVAWEELERAVAVSDLVFESVAEDAAVKAAVVRNGAVYLAALGGAGALMAKSVQTLEVIAWPDLGCEAVRRLTVKDMPLTVILDAHGGDLYQSGPAAYLEAK